MTRRSRSLVTCTIALVAFALGLAASPLLLRGDAPPIDDPLARFDVDFRGYYAAGRAASLAKIDPIILVQGDHLVLLHDGHRTQVEAIPRMYHVFKAVAHVPLALFARLDNTPDGPIDDATRADLDRMRDGLAAVVPTLDGRGFTPGQLARQRAIIRATLSHIDTLRSTGRSRRADLVTLVRSLGDDVLANAADAVALQFEGYDRCVDSWRKEVPAGAWKGLRVVILDKQTPRVKYTATQYFAKVLGVPGEGIRLVYAEEIAEESKALNLLATHQLDTDIGVAFFDDPDRMFRDLLGDAAQDYIKAHPVEAFAAP